MVFELLRADDRTQSPTAVVRVVRIAGRAVAAMGLVGFVVVLVILGRTWSWHAGTVTASGTVRAHDAASIRTASRRNGPHRPHGRPPVLRRGRRVHRHRRGETRVPLVDLHLRSVSSGRGADRSLHAHRPGRCGHRHVVPPLGVPVGLCSGGRARHALWPRLRLVLAPHRASDRIDCAPCSGSPHFPNAT